MDARRREASAGHVGLLRLVLAAASLGFLHAHNKSTTLTEGSLELLATVAALTKLLFGEGGVLVENVLAIVTCAFVLLADSVVVKGRANL